MDSASLLLIKEYMDEQYYKYCHSSFIDDDPVQIPHLFSSQQNVEIAGFMAASFAWGQRKTIINKSKDLLSRMDNSPHDFIVNHTDADLTALKGFKHRTFSDNDAIDFVRALAKVYRRFPSMDAYLQAENVNHPLNGIRKIRSLFVDDISIRQTVLRHVANVDKGSAAKRINMFFRWMVRHDAEGIDFGLWSTFKPADLIVPLDLHVGNISREIGLLKRTQNDLKAALELTEVLKQMDPTDPVKYDFSLFCLGVYGVQLDDAPRRY